MQGCFKYCEIFKVNDVVADLSFLSLKHKHIFIILTYCKDEKFYIILFSGKCLKPLFGPDCT